MRPLAVVPLACFLALCGCSPAKHAITVVEPMIWQPSKDRSLIELRYLRDPRYYLTVCSGGLLERLKALDKRNVRVEHRVWGVWPWSTTLYGFNPVRLEGMPIPFCDHPGQLSGFRGVQRPGIDPRHPLERHLRR